MGLGITVSRKKGKETGYCYGCGADLVRDQGHASGAMATTPKKLSHWAEHRHLLKKSQLKNWALCPRCRELNKLQTTEDGTLSVEATELLGPDPKMMQVFRSEVSKIRQQEKAVVVFCVDAINISGTMIRTIRNYVGGNPILLAVTRCDLLPDYVFEKSLDELKQIYADRCREIQPAAVYLCSEDPVKMHQIGGIKQLAADLWSHLNGRDPYIIGAANIGKSTLTDILIAGFVNRGLRSEHFRDRLSQRRVEKLRESRVTKSALPGTTLQNIRVPCFSDHKQALWDTPGLLLDVSLAHFPVRNLKYIRAQRPNRIEPRYQHVTLKSFALLITEEGDDVPLLRVEVRLKKDETAATDASIHLVWNSILNLQTHIVEIPHAHDAERERMRQQKVLQTSNDSSDQQQPVPEQRSVPLSAEERKQRREERKRAHEARIQAEQKEVGRAEWYRRQAALRAQAMEFERDKLLSRLSEVNQVVVEARVGMDVCIANFGWLGFVGSHTAMIKTFAPNTGVQVTSHATLALPHSVGRYQKPRVADRPDEEDDMYSEDGMDEFDFGLDEDFMSLDDEADYGEFDEFFQGEYDDEGSHKQRWYQRERYVADKDTENDPWAQLSGKHVGWHYDADTRSHQGAALEGWNPIVKDLNKETKETTDEYDAM